MADSYYNSNYTGAQIDAAISLIRNANITSEQLAALAGVTGSIQGQLDTLNTNKLDSNSNLNPANLSAAVPVAKGGTGAATAENARTNLGAQKKHTTASVTIAVADWNSSNQCTKNVSGVTASNSLVVSADPASFENWRNFGVRMSAQAAGTVTFICVSKPSSAITANILILD